VGGCLSFPAGLKKSKCNPKHFGSKNEKRNFYVSCTKKISHVI
jgi:hypothetical protein